MERYGQLYDDIDSGSNHSAGNSDGIVCNDFRANPSIEAKYRSVGQSSQKICIIVLLNKMNMPDLTSPNLLDEVHKAFRRKHFAIRTEDAYGN